MNHRKYITAIILGLTASWLTSCKSGGNTSDTPAVVPEPIVVAPPPVMPEPTKEEQLAKLEAELATVEAEIKAMIGQAQCASSLDCRSVDHFSETALQGCGGSGIIYAAYSIVETNQETLAAAHTKRVKLGDNIFRIKNGLPSNYVASPLICAQTIEPQSVYVVNCSNNQCQGMYQWDKMPPPVYQTDVITLNGVTTMIGDPVCSSSEQCGVWSVGYSSAECGETTTFAYSTFATDPKQIAEKVGQYAQSVAANYNAQGFNAVCQSNVSFTNGVCRNEKCQAN